MKMSQKRLGRPSLGGLLATRQGSLTLAVLCAAVAAGVLMFALRHYKSSLRAAPQPATVLVATAEIPKGTPGQTIAGQHLYKPEQVVTSQVSPGALSDAGGLAGEVTASNILPGQQLAAVDFTTSAGVTGMLSPSQRAVSITTDEAHGDTDALQAGDHVDVYDHVPGVGQVLLDPDVLVIKPAGGPAKAGGTTLPGSALVLAIDTKLVPEVLYAADSDKLYLALRPTDASKSPGGLGDDRTILQAAVNVAANSTTNQTKAH